MDRHIASTIFMTIAVFLLVEIAIFTYVNGPVKYRDTQTYLSTTGLPCSEIDRIGSMYDGTYIGEGISMYPTIDSGSVTFCKNIPFDNVSVGNIVVYRTIINNSIKLVQHRVIARSANYLYVKGDNNNYVDPVLVTKNNYVCTTAAIIYGNYTKCANIKI